MDMREIKFRAFQDNKMLISPISSNYGLNRFFGMLYEDAPIMQFTGLKDRNGVDIYEGDVLSWESYEGTKNQIRWVVDFDKNRGFKAWISSKNDEIIIGNIYQNPELL